MIDDESGERFGRLLTGSSSGSLGEIKRGLFKDGERDGSTDGVAGGDEGGEKGVTGREISMASASTSAADGGRLDANERDGDGGGDGREEVEAGGVGETIGAEGGAGVGARGDGPRD